MDKYEWLITKTNMIKRNNETKKVYVIAGSFRGFLPKLRGNLRECCLTGLLSRKVGTGCRRKILTRKICSAPRKDERLVLIKVCAYST